jgi:hypothetical protein
MFGTHFYNETIKRSVSIFGTLFNNIYVSKIKADGTVLTKNLVPIAYGPSQKWLKRLAEEPDLNDLNRSAVSLPRMGFELSSFEYDATRQQNKLIRTQKNLLETTDSGKRGFQYAPAPYNLGFTLSILSKNMNDAIQIVEQIIPYFQPEYTVTMNMIDSMSEKRDVPITLNSVSMGDSYEGAYDENRIIEYTLDFSMKTYFFGPVFTGEVIKSVIERDYVNIDAGGFTTSQIDGSGLVKEVKHYEPAFQEFSNAVSNSTTITFPSAINSKISASDEVFGTGNATNPTIVSVASDKLSMVISNSVTVGDKTKLKFVGSVDPSDTFVVAETVSFYDDGAPSTFTEDKVTDAS